MPCESASTCSRRSRRCIGAASLHRDLKPTNMFLTEHGAKLLDFGVARSDDHARRTTDALTGAGRWSARPAIWRPSSRPAAPLDARAPICSQSARCSTRCWPGDPPSTASTAVRVFHAIMYEQPPALGGPAHRGRPRSCYPSRAGEAATGTLRVGGEFCRRLAAGSDDLRGLETPHAPARCRA